MQKCKKHWRINNENYNIKKTTKTHIHFARNYVMYKVIQNPHYGIIFATSRSGGGSKLQPQYKKQHHHYTTTTKKKHNENGLLNLNCKATSRAVLWKICTSILALVLSYLSNDSFVLTCIPAYTHEPPWHLTIKLREREGASTQRPLRKSLFLVKVECRGLASSSRRRRRRRANANTYSVPRAIAYMHVRVAFLLRRVDPHICANLPRSATKP